MLNTITTLLTIAVAFLALTNQRYIIQKQINANSREKWIEEFKNYLSQALATIGAKQEVLSFVREFNSDQVTVENQITMKEGYDLVIARQIDADKANLRFRLMLDSRNIQQLILEYFIDLGEILNESDQCSNQEMSQALFHSKRQEIIKQSEIIIQEEYEIVRNLKTSFWLKAKNFIWG